VEHVAAGPRRATASVPSIRPGAGNSRKQGTGAGNRGQAIYEFPLKVLRKAHFHKKIKNIFPVRLLQNPSGVFAREKSAYRSQEPECE
jgi:DNA mismatch repair protein MutH